MREIIEALDAADQVRVLDIQKDIIDIKQQIVNTDDSGRKERFKGEIEDLQKRIQSIKDAADQV